MTSLRPAEPVRGRRAWTVGLVVLGVLLAVAALWRTSRGSESTLLVGSPAAPWIRDATPISLLSRSRTVQEVSFFRRFSVDETTEELEVGIGAFRDYRVFLNGMEIDRLASRSQPWLKLHPVTLPIRRGHNEIEIRVTHPAGVPALRIADAHNLVSTRQPWHTVAGSGAPRTAIDVRSIGSFDISWEFPSSMQAIVAALPVLLLTAGVALLVVRFGRRLHSALHLTPRHLRNGLLLAVALLFLNNLFRIRVEAGFDAGSHYDYIRFILENGQLPLASDGWQMFQPPLFYLLSLGPFLLGGWFLDEPYSLMLVRLVPMACWLLTIEIGYRTARLVYPDRPGPQALATLIGGLMPIGLYISQVVGNEPLAGCLAAALIYRCFALEIDPSRATPREGLILGLLWGLALLGKLTSLLLLVPLVWVLIRAVPAQGGRRVAATGASALGVTALVSGWFYVRNWIVLGKPFIGGWDPSRGIGWWQDPGYRTLDDLYSFGFSLAHPIYAAIHGFWDGVYSTLWLDAYLLSAARRIDAPPWNYDLMLAMALIALPMTAAFAVGTVRAWRRPESTRSGTLRLASICVATYLFAILLMFLQVPIYSTTKSTYALAVVPCLGLLAAAGLEPLLAARRGRTGVLVYVSVWVVAAFGAYLVL